MKPLFIRAAGERHSCAVFARAMEYGHKLGTNFIRDRDGPLCVPIHAYYHHRAFCSQSGAFEGTKLKVRRRSPELDQRCFDFDQVIVRNGAHEIAFNMHTRKGVRTSQIVRNSNGAQELDLRRFKISKHRRVMNAPACIVVNETDTCLEAERFTLRHLSQEVIPRYRLF
jgi:hypothetical protein